MKFWDSSAILPLIVKESTSQFLIDLRKSDEEMVVWWGTETECLSALARKERDGGLDRKAVSYAEDNLEKILSCSYEVQPAIEVRRIARRLLMTHPLRAADSLQLASALVFAGIQVPELPFVTLDKNLASSAGKEGFSLVSIATIF
jgi:predicted nucleic acid-binding protein